MTPAASGRFFRTRFVGTGSALPDTVMTNAELEKKVDTSDEWIRSRTGIRERRILEPGQDASDLATRAGLRACEAAGIAPAELDAIIVGTVTGDLTFPATATIVQHKLGARAGIPAFDLSAACAGFLYGLGVADGFISRGGYRNVLVIGVEVLSRIVDWTDRNTCVLFGDGAGAVVLRAEPGEPGQAAGRGLLSSHLYADGAHAETLCMPAGGTRERVTAEVLAQKRNYVSMNGREVYRHAVKGISAACLQALEANQVTSDQVDWVVAHQANIRILEAVSERVAIPLDRFHLNLERFGNTSSASVPIALDEAVRAGKIRPGQLVLTTAFGGGFAWGSALLRWG